MDCIVPVVAKSQTRLSSFHFTSLSAVLGLSLCGCCENFLLFLEISVLVHHLQFFDEPTTATPFPV